MFSQKFWPLVRKWQQEIKQVFPLHQQKRMSSLPSKVRFRQLLAEMLQQCIFVNFRWLACVTCLMFASQCIYCLAQAQQCMNIRLMCHVYNMPRKAFKSPQAGLSWLYFYWMIYCPSDKCEKLYCCHYKTIFATDNMIIWQHILASCWLKCDIFI